jgi:hypothetical protein
MGYAVSQLSIIVLYFCSFIAKDDAETLLTVIKASPSLQLE